MRRRRFGFFKIFFIVAIAIIAFVSIRTIYESLTFDPEPFFEIPFRERSKTKSDDDVRVTVAVLSAKESRRVFGVNLARDRIQPVWVRVENHDTTPYWLMSSGLDPDYFSPLEAAYLNHSIFSDSRNAEIDDHFRALSFRNPVVSGASVSGFFFVNLDEGMKVVDIDLVARGKFKFFTFFVTVPGLKADYHEVDFEGLYPKKEIVEVDENQLRTALNNLPCCATGEDGTENGDPLNLVLIGSREDINAAFIRRGWLAAEQTYAKAVWKTIKSFVFGSRYRYSPLSPLYLYGRQQDFAAQKPRHTIHQRNHLRVWLSPMRYRGKPVWVGQVSRDIGVRFTLEAWPPVTHKIDPDVDDATFSQVEDLIYSQQLAKTGWVKGVGVATRSKPRENLTGDPYFTAGFRAVLLFDRRPFSFEDIQSFDWGSPVSSKIKRLTIPRQPDFDEQAH
jgi:hypothetical protein